MVDQENDEFLKLSPVKKEIFAKVQKAQCLLLEAFNTNIDGNTPYEASSVMSSMMGSKGSPEYQALCDELLVKIEELQQYILNKGLS